jgi:hypothetical protein
MDGTILQQGSFLANFSGLANPNPGNIEIGQANQTIIQIPANADWMYVRNYTQRAIVGEDTAYFNGVANASTAFEYYWQRGYPAGSADVLFYDDATQAVWGDRILSGGFTLYDPSGQSAGSLPQLGNPVGTNASTNVTRPVVSSGNTAGLYIGAVVRMSNTAQTDVNGIDMVVGAVNANNNFTLLTATNPLANAPGAVGGAGFYRIVNYDALYYPRHRYVVNITRAVNAQVSTSVAHGLTPGQEVRFNIPAVSGMVQLNPTPGNMYEPAIILTVVDDYNFTINIDTSAFTAFTWPTVAQQPSSFPQVVPFGEDTATSLITVAPQVPSIAGQRIFGTQSGLLADATSNTGFLGMVLGTGGTGVILTTPILGPSGSISWSAGNVATPDLMYWVAGKSSYGGL